MIHLAVVGIVGIQTLRLVEDDVIVVVQALGAASHPQWIDTARRRSASTAAANSGIVRAEARLVKVG